MTQKFAEYVNEMAKGLNFPQNAWIMGTAIDNGENLDMTIHYDGACYNVREIIKCMIENYLKPFDDEQARYERDVILDVIAKDEERRM